MAQTVYTREAFCEFARKYAASLVPRRGGACTIALHGGLGSGKTTFVQDAAAALGVTQKVTSPTFVIQKIYQLKRPPFSRFVHIDAYRLEDAGETRALKLQELLADKGAVVFVEWAEKIKEALPKDTEHLHFSFVSDDKRSISHD